MGSQWLDIDMMIRKMFIQLLFPFILFLAKAESQDSRTTIIMEKECFPDTQNGEKILICQEKFGDYDYDNETFQRFVKETIYSENGDLLSETVQDDVPQAAAGAHPVDYTSGVGGSSNLIVQTRECACSSFARRPQNGVTLGDCRSRYRGGLWCYVEADTAAYCRDKTWSKRTRRYWSYSACYLEE